MPVLTALHQQVTQVGVQTAPGTSVNLVLDQANISMGVARASVQTTVMDTGYNSVARCSLPEGDQSLPLGDHILLATVEKI